MVAYFLSLAALFALAAATAAVPNRASRPRVPPFVALSGAHYAPAASGKSPGKPAAKATVYLFLATDCPLASRGAPGLARFARHYERRGVRVFAVYPDAGETDAGVRWHAGARGLGGVCPVVRGGGGEIARALGATMTPEAVLLGADGAVRFRGSVDGLSAATEAVLRGEKVRVAAVPAVGCLIRGAAVSRVSGAVSLSAPSPSVTYARDVAPLLDRRCVSCHRAGEVAPMPLGSFRAAAPWAAGIARAAARRAMPPWKADSHGEFQNEARLTDAEIKTLADWAESGAPLGNVADLPKERPVFPAAGAWTLGEPDAVFETPAGYTIPAEGRDVYRCFVLPTHYDADKWVGGIEFQPGNRAVVHHINIWLDTSGAARRLAAKSGGVGYDSPAPGNVPGFVSAGCLGGWIPGHQPWTLPQGVGNLLPRGADIVFEVHYVTTGVGGTDRSRFGVRWARGTIHKRLRLGDVSASGFVLPAGDAAHRVDTCDYVREPITLLSVTPHMHNLGRSMKAVAVLPDGVPLPLVSVPDWDFAWQRSYRFREPVSLPQNTRIDVSAVFDNSAGNAKNPNRPPRDVRNGERTTDEMCNLFVAYTMDGEDLAR